MHTCCSITDHFTEIYYDAMEESTDQVIERILNTIFKKKQIEWENELKDARLKQQKIEIKRLKEQKEAQNALIALLGIGLGLAILTTIAKD